ncbi:MAG: hypothetical protein PF505_11320 [Vallitaleaceae bacterium]|nr:hypothetical protein [Vallitaleaceae bacterium]
MKKFIALFLMVVIVSSVLTGCSKPIDTYKKSVDYAELQAKVEEISGLVDDLLALAVAQDDIEPDVEAESVEVFLAELGLSDVMDSSQAIIDKVDDIEAGFDELDIDTEDEDVKALHEPLMDALSEYKDMASGIIEVSTVTEDLMVETYNLSVLATEFGTEVMVNMFNLSAGFSSAIFDNQETYLGEFEYLSSEEFQAMMDSGTIDPAQLQAAIGRVEDVKAQIEALETDGDADVTIKNILLTLVDNMVSMYTVLIDGASTLALTADYEGLNEFIQEYIDANAEGIDNWISGMEE